MVQAVRAVRRAGILKVRRRRCHRSLPVAPSRNRLTHCGDRLNNYSNNCNSCGMIFRRVHFAAALAVPEAQ